MKQLRTTLEQMPPDDPQYRAKEPPSKIRMPQAVPVHTGPPFAAEQPIMTTEEPTAPRRVTPPGHIAPPSEMPRPGVPPGGERPKRLRSGEGTETPLPADFMTEEQASKSPYTSGLGYREHRNGAESWYNGSASPRG